MKWLRRFVQNHPTVAEGIRVVVGFSLVAVAIVGMVMWLAVSRQVRDGSLAASNQMLIYPGMVFLGFVAMFLWIWFYGILLPRCPLCRHTLSEDKKHLGTSSLAINDQQESLQHKAVVRKRLAFLLIIFLATGLSLLGVGAIASYIDASSSQGLILGFFPLFVLQALLMLFGAKFVLGSKLKCPHCEAELWRDEEYLAPQELGVSV